MVVHPSLPGTMKEYVALAKSKPNTLTYASGGTGAITQMVGELLKLTAGIQVREIPYKAIGAELPDLTGGHVSTAFLSPVVIRDMVRSGKLRGVAVASTPAPGHPARRADDGRGAATRSRAWAGTASSSPPARRARSSTGCSWRSAAVLQHKEIQDDAATLGTIGRRRQARGIRRVRARRSAEVGQGHQGRQHQGAVGGAYEMGFVYLVLLVLSNPLLRATVAHQAGARDRQRCRRRRRRRHRARARRAPDRDARPGLPGREPRRRRRLHRLRRGGARSMPTATRCSTRPARA